MKIEPGTQPTTADRLSNSQQVNGADAGTRGAAGTRPGTDAIAVSGDAHLVAEAATRIGDVGQDVVRPDVVERAKAALERGEVGADVDRLADRIIDRLLDE